jgi:mono/diheme cytochrome c family protein
MKILRSFSLIIALLTLVSAQTVRADAAADAQIAKGKSLYTNCVACHQATGLGVPAVFPPLAGSEVVNGSEEHLIRIVLHGLSGKVTVNKVVYNGNMPAFGQGLGFNWTDEKVAAVLTYVRQAWTNKSGPITKDQVTAIRTKAVRKTPWTATELESVK